MSQLIHLKQRIKAIKVIQKITHAMRLIAMSSHSKLKRRAESLETFKNELMPLLCALDGYKKEQTALKKPKTNKELLFFIASEKGLCGSFNNIICSYFLQLYQERPSTYDIITIGKKATEFALKNKIKPIQTINKLSSARLQTVSAIVYEKVMQYEHEYTSINFIYNHPTTFFIQKPTITRLLPLEPLPVCNNKDRINLQDYIWFDKPEKITKAVFDSLLQFNILHTLAQSMIAEQSSRFLSMDSSTRNADNFLKTMQLEYNKLRQAKITKELSELASTF